VPAYDDGPYLAAIDDFVATSTDWTAAPAIGDCMVSSGGQLEPVVKDAIVAYGLLGALQRMDSIGPAANAFGAVWTGCMAEGEQAMGGGSGGGSGSSTTQPACRGSLTTLPVERSQIMGVAPLGHLNPPAHTQSTDHVYFLLPGYDTQNAPSVPIVAPADGRVVNLTSYSSDSSGSMFTDWQIEYSVCADGTLKFGHVTTISDALVALTRGQPGDCNSYGYTGNMTESCRWSGEGVSLALSVGDSLGTAAGLGTPNSALDLWAFDWVGDLAPAIDQSAQNEGTLRTVCPLDWFTDDLRTELYGMRREFNGIAADEATGCGKVFQDVAGTAKGFWYATAPVEGTWLDHLALVDTNFLSTVQAISVAALVADPGYWYFSKQSSGTVNRDFAEVASGSGVYCYDTFTADSNGPAGDPDHFLIEVVNDDTLHIEHKSGSCGGGATFTSPHVYSRYQQ